MTPMQEHRAANPAPNPDDKHAVLGYLVEPEDVGKLTVICKQLQGGTDRERDLGHRLWLIINALRDLPVTQGDLKDTDKPAVYRAICGLRSCDAEFWAVEGQYHRCPQCNMA